MVASWIGDQISPFTSLLVLSICSMQRMLAFLPTTLLSVVCTGFARGLLVTILLLVERYLEAFVCTDQNWRLDVFGHMDSNGNAVGELT